MLCLLKAVCREKLCSLSLVALSDRRTDNIENQAGR